MIGIADRLAQHGDHRYVVAFFPLIALKHGELDHFELVNVEKSKVYKIQNT